MDDYGLATKLFSSVLKAGISARLQGQVYRDLQVSYQIHTFGLLRTAELKALVLIAEANEDRVTLEIDDSGRAVLAIPPLI
jgi:hypothetical protein